MLIILCVAVLAVFDTTHAGCSRAEAEAESGSGPPPPPQDPPGPAQDQGPPAQGHGCGRNSHYELCGRSCPVTCYNYNNATRTCTDDCKNGCRCNDGYVRDGNRCIKPKYCPPPVRNQQNPDQPAAAQGPAPCPENTHFEECGASCPETCENYQDPDRVCTDECLRGCACDKGLVRGPDYRCIPPEQCPVQDPPGPAQDQDPPAQRGHGCGRNSHYEICGRSCPVTCYNYRNRTRTCTDDCKKGCRCNDGYVRDGNRCIKPKYCPPPVRNQQSFVAASQDQDQDQGPGPVTMYCPINQHYEDCGTECPDTCDNYMDTDRACTTKCRKGCQCNSGLVLSSNGDCVDPSKCPKKSGQSIADGSTAYCGKNQHYEQCGTDCPATCANYYDPPSGCAAVCRAGCQCNDGFILDPNGNCVPPGQCPGNNRPPCPKNERYNDCGSSCPVTCQRLNGGASQSCSTECVKGCECANGFVRDTQSGNCVRAKDCPKNSMASGAAAACGQNEYYSSCRIPCNDCQARGNCNYYCYYGCDCIQGYYRNADGKCVAAANCPNNCKKNEVFTNCQIPCNDCYNRGNCYYYCYNGCNCRSGYYNDANGNCIPANQCPANNG